jgi:hypothetical protein
MNDIGMTGSNACAGILDDDRKCLESAATMLVDAQGFIIALSQAVAGVMGGTVGRVGDLLAGFSKAKLGLDLKEKAEEVIEAGLWSFHSISSFGLDEDNAREPWDWFHKAVATASGATGGFFGTAGLLWDLPVTTSIIMRSVTEIARSFPDEKIGTDDTKRACIEVFAFGGPETDDDDADKSYWATRAGLGHTTIEALIKAVVPRLGFVLSEKVVAQSVPVLGCIAGAGLNYAFIDYYQQMARVHFTVRGVEKRSADSESVRACFSHHVQKVREGRKLRKGPMS